MTPNLLKIDREREEFESINIISFELLFLFNFQFYREFMIVIHIQSTINV
jgi:hypothetical protein